ncbi:MAG: hypothetical protein HC831_09475 [Chloroflexia bacterium]|nr:hypothetical protein [Chloroflexia bacterium]
MNKRLLNLLLVFLTLTLALSCKQDDDLSIEEKSKLKGTLLDCEYIEYGTSFGECYGYCIRKVNISSSKIVFEKKSWNLEDYPIVTITDLNNEESWKNLFDKVNYESFQQLPPILGCPDCADGGAEWLEIKKMMLFIKLPLSMAMNLMLLRIIFRF